MPKIDPQDIVKIKFVPAPRDWEESTMGIVRNYLEDVIHEGTILECRNWLIKYGFVPILGSNGAWYQPSPENILIALSKKLFARSKSFVREKGNLPISTLGG